MRRTTRLFIDLDGTIMVNPFLTVVFPFLIEALTPQMGITGEALVAECVAEHERRESLPETYSAAMVMDWDDIIETVVARYGLELPRKVYDLVIEHCCSPYISIIEDSAAILAEIAQAPHRSLVVSSKGLSRYQMPVLDALGLTPLFDDFLMPDLTGYLKTDARFFDRYTSHDTSDLFISIGDTYRDDVICPKQFGFYSIWKKNLPELAAFDPLERVTYLPPAAALPDAVILTLAELPATIATLEAKA